METSGPPTTPDGPGRTRAHLVEVAAQLLREHGLTAVTTRSVAQAAGAQAPTIYRLFGDKEGLLDAVAEHAMASYVAGKAVADHGDPVADLRAAWETNIGFGLDNPAVFALLLGRGGTEPSPATTAGVEVLRARVRRVAAAGRLRVPEERAVQMIRAAGTGAVATLLSTPPGSRDPALADAVWAAITAAILTAAPALPGPDPGGATAAAVTFRTLVPDLDRLTGTERALMAEWLDRAAGA